jgi:sec-independent protein translocase protein TatC
MRRKASPAKEDAPRPFIEHVRELKKRLIVSIVGLLGASVLSYVFYDLIIDALFRPFGSVNSALSQGTLFVNTVVEGFLTRLRIALICGAVLSMPLHLFNAVRFVFPGLNATEKRVVSISLGASFILIVLSGYYGYFNVIPISIRFLMNAGFVPENVGVLLSFQRNVMYLFQFLLATLILFQIPVVLEVLLALNVVTRKALLRASRYVIVGTFVLSAVMTPPDFVSQLSLALPLVVLYYLTIGLARLLGFGKG